MFLPITLQTFERIDNKPPNLARTEIIFYSSNLYSLLELLRNSSISIILAHSKNILPSYPAHSTSSLYSLARELLCMYSFYPKDVKLNEEGTSNRLIRLVL